MTRTIVVSTLAAVALAALPAAAPAQGFSGFRTVSGTVACAGSGATVRCDLRTITNTPPRPRPASCELDWGTFFAITTGGARGTMLCAGDTVLGEPFGPLYPQRTWRYRTIRCTATGKASVRCVNRRGHGFSINSGRQRLF